MPIILAGDVMTTNETTYVSFFPADDRNDTGGLLLSSKRMTDWWEISLSIFLWMLISFTAVSLGATLISLVSLRKHPYVCFLIIPIWIMIIIVPSVFGGPTSMILAFALTASNNAVSTWYCMILGIIQTVAIFLVSLTKLYATL